MKVKCKIDYVAHVDSKDQYHWIELEINGQVFIMDREDLWELYRIVNTAFDRMVDVKEAIPPILNHESVMKAT